MRQFKSIWLILGVALIMGLAVWSCGSATVSGGGGGGGGSAAPAELSSTVGTGSEDISAIDVGSLGSSGSSPEADLAAPEGGIAKSLDEISVSALVTNMPDATLGWFLMIPTRRHLRAEARDQIEAPSHLAYYIWVNRSDSSKVPACVTVTPSAGCPMVPNNASSVCNVDINFGSSCDFTLNGITLNLSGELEHSSSVVQVSSGATVYNGVWDFNDTAVNFKITDPVSGKWLNYNGLVTKSSNGTGAPTYQYTWNVDSANNPVVLTDSAGETFTTDGTHDLTVLPGTSAELTIDAYPAVKLSVGATVTWHRVSDKTLHVQGSNTVDFGITSQWTNTNNGNVWIRNGTYTLYRLDTNPTTEVEVNGTGSITDPASKVFTASLNNVVLNMALSLPESGTEVITFPDATTYTVTFTGVCSLSWVSSKNTSGTLDYCDWDSYSG